MRIHSLVPPAALALVVFLLAGCGEEQADVKSLSRYTPEILVEETLARYKAAVKATKGGGEGPAAAKSGKGKIAGPGDDGAKINAAAARFGEEFRARESAETTKAAPIDDVFDGVVRKAPLIEGVSVDQVYAKLGEAVDYDPELSSAEKDAFKDGLAEARKKGPTSKKE